MKNKLALTTAYLVISIIMNIAVFSNILSIIAEILIIENWALKIMCIVGISSVIATLPITFIDWLKTVRK
jgi:hypothetical protein